MSALGLSGADKPPLAPADYPLTAQRLSGADKPPVAPADHPLTARSASAPHDEGARDRTEPPSIAIGLGSHRFGSPGQPPKNRRSGLAGGCVCRAEESF